MLRDGEEWEAAKIWALTGGDLRQGGQLAASATTVFFSASHATHAQVFHIRPPLISAICAKAARWNKDARVLEWSMYR